jgi:murein DD-endopeptidase MepM/ murein hydrolase activator NlpD
VNTRRFIQTDNWRRDLRTFGAGAACGSLAGAVLVTMFLWQYNWIVKPWTTRGTGAASSVENRDAGTRTVEAHENERPIATSGNRAPVEAAALPPAASIGPAPGNPDELKDRDLLIPVDGVKPEQLTRQFSDQRGGSRQHEAIDILAPRNTPVRAVENGTIAKLFLSKAGGITVYQFDPDKDFCYYYAHLERYAEGLREGQAVEKGQVIGYVGTSGNAPQNTPHLHFAIFRLTEDKRWWEGTAIDPYDVLR